MDPKARKRGSTTARRALALTLALCLAGCPGGAELENAERFAPYFAGASGSGSSGTGASGITGAPGGTAGAGVTTPASCDVDITKALKDSCARSFCHDGASHYAGLNLLVPEALAAELVDKPATHGDIGCYAPGEPFRACNAAEIASICPPNALLLDSQSPDDSWVVRKLTPGGAMGCGDDMPAPPGNSPTYGWSEQRRNCLLDFFRSLVEPPPG